jgi:hypothetical protein
MLFSWMLFFLFTVPKAALYFHAGTSHYYQSVVLGVYPAKSQPVVLLTPVPAAGELVPHR